MTMQTAAAGKAIRPDNRIAGAVRKTLLYAALILLSVVTLIPFVWMLSSSLKLDREVFEFPIRWIPQTFHWENYSLIWTKAPMLMYAVWRTKRAQLSSNQKQELYKKQTPNVGSFSKNANNPKQTPNLRELISKRISASFTLHPPHRHLRQQPSWQQPFGSFSSLFQGVHHQMDL